MTVWKSGWGVRMRYLNLFGEHRTEWFLAGVYMFDNREAKIPEQWRGLTIAVFRTRALAREAARSRRSEYLLAVPVQLSIEINEAGKA
jgi:hypothetical protein